MAFITINFRKRKNRYFLVAYGSKKVIILAAPAAAKGSEPDPFENKNQKINTNTGEMLFGSLSLTLEPDQKTNDQTPHIARGQAIELIQKQNPDHNYIAIMNIIEMKEKDFLQWNG